MAIKLESEDREQMIGLFNNNKFIFNSLSTSNSNISNKKLAIELINVLQNQNNLKLSEIYDVVYEEPEIMNNDYVDLRNPNINTILDLIK